MSCPGRIGSLYHFQGWGEDEADEDWIGIGSMDVVQDRKLYERWGGGGLDVMHVLRLGG